MPIIKLGRPRGSRYSSKRHPFHGLDMAAVRRTTATLAADVAGYRRLMSADEEAAQTSRLMGADEVPVSKVPAAYFVAPSLIMLFAIAGATWLVWRFVSLELTAVYAEGFRKVVMPEE